MDDLRTHATSAIFGQNGPEAYKNTRPTNEAMQFTSVCGFAKGREAAKLSPFVQSCVVM